MYKTQLRITRKSRVVQASVVWIIYMQRPIPRLYRYIALRYNKHIAYLVYLHDVQYVHIVLICTSYTRGLYIGCNIIVIISNVDIHFDNDLGICCLSEITVIRKY